MSSSRPADPPTAGSEPADPAEAAEHPAADAAAADHGRRDGRRPMSLRSKLILGMVAVITVVCVTIGIVTQLFLSSYLTEQKDRQLIAAQDRSIGGYGGKWKEPAYGPGLAPTPDPAAASDPCSAEPESEVKDGHPDRPDFLFLPGQAIGTLGARIDDDAVIASGILAGSNTCTPISTVADDALLAVPVDGVPHTVTIDGADYRVLASHQRDGSVVITGLPMADVSSTQQRLTVIMAVVTGFALLIGGALVFVTVRRSLRPLERVAGTARAVSELPLHSGEVDLGVRVPERDTDPRTEVGQVGAALNQMLRHVSDALESRQASETRVRRFVADASHELRTPLAAIRGYAELAGRSGDDPAVVSNALRRVESESLRMTSLVDDLLLLARLDSRNPLSAEPVDLTLLALDAVADARVAGPGHRWQLDLPDEPVVVTGDRAGLHQVLGNLLANARTHTPAGTTVVAGLRTEGDEVVLTVTDDGPGIDPDLQPEVFNRFVRGDSSRSRAVGSTGLGLAIVAAVTSAHAGSVSVDSRPGRTVFTVRLSGAGPAGGQPGGAAATGGWSSSSCR